LFAIIIASVCYKILRKRFFNYDNIDLIQPGGYMCNISYSKKVLKCFVYWEKNEGKKILNGPTAESICSRNCLTSVRKFSLGDVYRVQDLRVFTSRPYVSYFLLRHYNEGDKLDERYERTHTRMERISRHGYRVEVQRD
jgi:hypothetical protein